jgi:hypothetical protein
MLDKLCFFILLVQYRLSAVESTEVNKVLSKLFSSLQSVDNQRKEQLMLSKVIEENFIERVTLGCI